MFKGRKIVIATKHEKEKAIAPILEKQLGVHCFVTPELDTDTLGTFTGEIERKEDPLATARHKCLMAMELTHCDLAIASEGSFGQHPSLFFAPADDEFLYFYDQRHKLEISVRELSLETNFNGSLIKTEAELIEFAHKVKFPSHGLILRKSKDELTDMVKGITKQELLLEAFYKLMHNFGEAYVETDMRAMYNPTRMQVIKLAAEKLVNKINTLCPTCNTPGFGITKATQGLPCEVCHSPTRSTLSYIHACQKCGYTKEEVFPNGKQLEDPTYCDLCNP